MYETPKAIHFRATLDGKDVNTDSALACRWQVAKACGELNMMNLSDDEFKAIGRACDKVNAILVKACLPFRISLDNA
jgi:hypothetical protein